VAREPARVCLIGAESTGKTTLCERLAEHFHAPWVAEYGREYTLEKVAGGEPYVWRAEEFALIAREQQRREDAAALTATRLVLCDTDAFATEIWLERYLGPVPLPADWPARERPMDLYLVSDPNVPFVGDEIRDGEHLREWMHARFIEELTRRSFPFEVLTGSYDRRFEQAVAAIDSLLAAER
jgi:NadR type nicotinamide-nucleotide adenylyltransferase